MNLSTVVVVIVVLVLPSAYPWNYGCRDCFSSVSLAVGANSTVRM